jgi:hypothetical protein
MLAGRSSSGYQPKSLYDWAPLTPGTGQASPDQPSAVRKNAIRPAPDTSCSTCASDTWAGSSATPICAAATRTAASTSVSRSVSRSEGGS